MCCDASAEFGVSTWWDLALLGVDLVIVGRLVSPAEGTTISAGVIDSAQGLFEASSAVARLVLLSVRLSRILFGSPLTWLARARPDELEPELDSAATLELILEVSM